MIRRLLELLKLKQPRQPILQQCSVSSRCEATDVRERMKVEIYKDLLVELYDFAYEQAVKTNTVQKLHDIDKRINGC